MKNIFKISIPFYFILIISFLIGKFKIFIFLTSITLFHELGHIISGLLLNWKIEQVIILPIGSLTIFNKRINNNFIKELLVTIMGPLFQIVLFFFIKQDIYMKYNLYLLIFNLLPIYPLDGYKILNLFLYKIIPFNTVNNLSLYFSIIILSILIILRPTNLIIYIVFIVFIIEIIKEIKNNPYIFNKFLLERYLYNIKFHKKSNINGENKKKMFKEKSHTFILKNKIAEEGEILAKMFDNP